VISEIQTAFAALHSATQVVSTLSSLHTEARVTEAVSEITKRLIEAQAAVMDANKRIVELEDSECQARQKLMDLENWQDEAGRYHLHEVVPGIFFYAVKETHRGSDPFHYLCPNCFVGKQKSIMQRPTNSSLEYQCPACSYKARTQSPAPRKVPVIRSQGFLGSY
jgi:lipopolysaccharide biosynthesis regulator YciM